MDSDNTETNDGEMQRRKLERGGQLHAAHWFIIGLSLILTVGAWYYSSEQISLKNQEKFQRDADQALALIKERMQLYENALSGGVALIHANKGVISYPTWKDYADSLNIEQKYPGVNGIGVIYNVKPSDLATFLEQERQFRPDFKIHPSHNEAEFWPITYIEPAVSNKQAIGLDMAFESNRYTAIQKARDTGTPQVTGPITLVQDDMQTPGFLFYAPFYKSHEIPEDTLTRRHLIVGVTYAPFIMQNLMRGTLDSEQRQVSLTIKDGDELLFEDTFISRDPQPLFSQTVSLEMYGRTWDFEMYSSLSFRSATENNQPYWILLGGLIIDSLIFAVFIFLKSANRKALKYADEMTVALKRKAKKLEKSNADLEQLAYIASHDLRAPLNAIKQVATWIEEDCADILPERSKEHLDLLKQRSLRMTQLLHDLRSYSQVNQFEDDRETINLKTSIQGISFLIGREQSVTCHAPDIEIDIQRVPFETVFRNLIANATKHHDQSKGTVTIRYAQETDAHVFHVEDDGPGIPDDMHEKVFEMYQTLRPRDQVEGSGMGLSIVSKILDHYDGTISLEKGHKRGARFLIHWPARHKEDAGHHTQP